MIGTFWNLCRACPSVPVDKLHSEYRSTYRWHELAGQRQEVVRRAPQNSSIGPISCEPALPRRRKHPELAYRTHDFLLSLDGGTEHLLEKNVIYDRARSEERWSHSRQKTSRRSKSEGPPAVQSTYKLLYNKGKDDVDGPAYNEKESAKPMSQSVEEGKTQKAATTTEYKLQFAWPPVSAVLSSGLSNICAPRKSISMSGIKSKGHIDEAAPVHRRALTKAPKEMILINGLANAVEQHVPAEVVAPSQPEVKPFSSEYKKQFQPFYNYNFDEKNGTFEKKGAEKIPCNNMTIDTQNSNWYKEVLMLRKKANQYRHRGWGTELVPEHIAQLYNDQINVWEQVSRRSTLSALSLATTLITKSPRSSPKAERDKDNKKSPSKSLTRLRGAKTEIDGSPSEKPRGRTVSAPKPEKSEATSAKSNPRMKPKTMVDRSSPKTRRTASTSRVRTTQDSGEPPKIVPSQTRRPRPTSLLPAPSSVSNNISMNFKGEPCEDGFPEVLEEQLVKSPPEPTRVKSPEQVVLRSPEPVNWTVPLDTGKTFTVTQNIRDGDLLPRSLSEARAWTPNSAPPPASVSAPPELVEPPVVR